MNEKNFLEKSRNVDNFFELLKISRKKIIEEIIKNNNEIYNFWGYIHNDPYCQCEMGTIYHSNDNIELRYFTCEQCKNMGRLINFRKKTIDNPFVLDYGNKKGSKMAIIKSEYIKKEIKENLFSKMYSSYILKNCKNLVNCQSPFDDLTYITSDKYTNNLIINWYLDYINIGNINLIYNIFNCRNHTYLMQELNDIKGLDEFMEIYHFNNEYMRSLFLSIIFILKNLENVSFTHGNPDVKSFEFVLKESEIKCLDMKINLPFTIKICNFENSSINIQTNDSKTRLNGRCNMSEQYIDKFPFICKITNFTIYTSEQHILTYKIPDSLMVYYIHNLGIPLYHSSLDLYVYIVNLMTNSHMRQFVLSDNLLYNLWKNLWMPDEFNIVMDLLPNKPLFIKEMLTFLSNFSLKCSALAILIDLIRSSI